MSKQQQIYYTAIFGGLGGLLGWWIIGSFALPDNIWLYATIAGAGLGLFIGGMIAASDGAIVKRAPVRAMRDGILGALAGALAGLIGLLIAQVIWFILPGGGFVARALSWMLMGMLIGMGDLLVSRRKQRALYAGLGGLGGGLVGGLIYEGLTQLFLAQSGAAQIALSGLGLMIVGACIGGLIPLARQVFSRGELRVLSGEQRGLAREVTDRATIGRYDGNDLYLPDAGIAWKHAVVHRANGGFMLDVLPVAESAVYIGAQPIAPGDKRALHSGDQLRIGEALVEFIAK